MRRETGKVFLACAIGAGIGSLVALEMARAFWWVGLLVGGLAGYLSYEWRAVLRAIPAAYRAARGWRTPPFFWKSGAWITLVLISAWFWVVLFTAGVFLSAETKPSLQPLASLMAIGFVMVIIFAAIATLLGIDAPTEQRANVATSFKLGSYWLAPPIVFFWHLPRGMWWVLKRLPRAMVVTVMGIARGVVAFARFMKRFSWELFLRIHSEMRLLCGVDAMLGAAVGYFAGSAIVGALAGGIFGVLNYAVVTERWLKPKGYLPIR